MLSYSMMKFIFKKCVEYAVANHLVQMKLAINLYKGMITFMIVGLTNHIPFVLHAAPVLHMQH